MALGEKKYVIPIDFPYSFSAGIAFGILAVGIYKMRNAARIWIQILAIYMFLCSLFVVLTLKDTAHSFYSILEGKVSLNYIKTAMPTFFGNRPYNYFLLILSSIFCIFTLILMNKRKIKKVFHMAPPLTKSSQTLKKKDK